MGDETEVRAKAPVVPKNEFDPTFNRVDSTDRTDTSGTAQPTKFQTEAWSRPDGAVSMPPGSVVEVDGKVYPSDKVVIQHADVVNIYQDGDTRDPRVARVEDNGDYIGDNYPRYNTGQYRIGHLPYDPGMQNPNSYHEMLRRGPQIMVDIGGQRHFPYHPQPFHPRHCFGDEPGPFFSHGGPRARINVGGIRIGDVTLGGSFNIPLGGNNDGDRGWGDQGWRQPGWSQPGWSQPGWSQPGWDGAPRVDVTANIDLHRRHHAQPCHDNYNESHSSGRVAANRARFNERMMAARQQMEMRRQHHS